MSCVVCCVLCVVCYVLCVLRCALCVMRCALCVVCCALCVVCPALCVVRCVLCALCCALCIVCCALCVVRCVCVCCSSFFLFLHSNATAVDRVTVVVFVVEVVLKVYAMSWRNYLSNGWNVIDFVVTVISVIEQGVTSVNWTKVGFFLFKPNSIYLSRYTYKHT